MPRDTEIIRLAFDLVRVVEAFMQHARRFFYEVMLSGYACSRCGGSLQMMEEGRCRCTACGHMLDPTVAFQRCTACGGQIRLRICRYQCRECGLDVPSHFVFDGIVFDREYFRERMADSRRRKHERREHLAHLVAENRSEPVVPPAADLQAIPGLLEALDSLSCMPELAVWVPLAKGFDLKRYETHVEAHLGAFETRFDDVPALDEDARLDRIWRFIAVIFMAHAGLLHITQHGHTIQIVRTNETDREGP